MRMLVSGGAEIIVDIKHAHTGFRNVLALVLLGAVAGVCFSLGMWQLSRASERDALHNAIERGRLQAPVTLSAESRSADMVPWRPATVEGRWSAEHTVLLENHNLDGRPGYWVATPLLFGAARDNDRYDGMLVLRGWLARDIGTPGAVPTVPDEPGAVKVSGELHSHVPRILELWSWAGGKSSELPETLPVGPGGASYPQVQNLEVQELAAASGLKLLPVVLAQTEDTALATDG